MAKTYKIYRSNDHDLRRQISDGLTELSDRIDEVVEYILLQPNILGVNINGGVDFTIGNNTDIQVPIQSTSSIGDNPPTLAGNIITINSAGVYQFSCGFALDTGSAGNAAEVNLRYEGVKGGRPAGVAQAAGQGAIAVQSEALFLFAAQPGDTVDIVATASDAAAAIKAQFSGGTLTQIYRAPLSITP